MTTNRDDRLRESAITFSISILRRGETDDWQEACHALANHRILGPWLRSRMLDSDDIAEMQGIVSEAEHRMYENADGDAA
jgi:hypothetical protein